MTFSIFPCVALHDFAPGAIGVSPCPTRYASLERPPYIRLTGAGRENLRVTLVRNLAEFMRGFPASCPEDRALVHDYMMHTWSLPLAVVANGDPSVPPRTDLSPYYYLVPDTPREGLVVTTATMPKHLDDVPGLDRLDRGYLISFLEFRYGAVDVIHAPVVTA